MPVTVVVSGIPRHISLTILAREFNVIFDTRVAEIGTFKVRELNDIWSGGKRRIALIFENGFDAMNVQQLLDGLNCNLSGNLHCFLKAKIQAKQNSPQRDNMEIVPSHNRTMYRCGDLGLMMDPELLHGAKATLKAKLKVLKKENAVLKAERKLLKQKKKLEREYKKLKSDESSDSEDETYAEVKKRKRPSKSPIREARHCRTKRSPEYRRRPSRSLEEYRSEHQRRPEHQSSTYDSHHRSSSYRDSKRRTEERRIKSTKEYRPRSPMGRILRSPEHTPRPPKIMSREDSRSRDFRGKSPYRFASKSRDYRPIDPPGHNYTRGSYTNKSTSPAYTKSMWSADYGYKQKARVDRQRKCSDSSSGDSNTLISSSSSVKKDAEPVESYSDFELSDKPAKSLGNERREQEIAKEQLLLETKSLVKRVIYDMSLFSDDKKCLYKTMEKMVIDRFTELSAAAIGKAADDLVSYYRTKHSEADDIEIVKTFTSGFKEKVKVETIEDDGEAPAESTVEPVSPQPTTKVDSIWNVVDEALLDIQIDEFKVNSQDNVSNDDKGASMNDANDSSQPEEVKTDMTQYPSEFTCVFQTPQVPDHPQFAIPIRVLIRQMEAKIKEATATCKYVCYVARKLIHERLTQIMKGKGYTRACLIIKAYREMYDRSGDEEFLKNIVDDINAGKYELYTMEAELKTSTGSNMSGSKTENTSEEIADENELEAGEIPEEMCHENESLNCQKLICDIFE